MYHLPGLNDISRAYGTTTYLGVSVKWYLCVRGKDP